MILDADVKVELIRRCLSAGSKRIEVASFVNPQRVPQMADAEVVVAQLGPAPEGVSFIGLVLNERGLDRALETTVEEVNFAVGASDGFNQANAGASPVETMTAIEVMVPRARSEGRKTTVTISVAFGCPYEGEVPVAAVRELAARAAAAGTDEVALGDTIGVAVPSDVTVRLGAVADVVGDASVRVHFHDTRNTAIANVAAALEGTVSVIDASVGGAGGCPFAPNATGNVATEDVLYLLDRMGIDSGVDPKAVMAITPWLSTELRRPLPAALTRAGWWPGPDARV